MNPEAIEKLIAAGRDSYEARLAAGQARLRQDDLPQATDHLRKATQLEPGQTMAWQELGSACQKSGDIDGAREAWQQGIDTARANGDKQAEKVMGVWLRRLDRQ